jgi:hypothetical protein
LVVAWRRVIWSVISRSTFPNTLEPPDLDIVVGVTLSTEEEAAYRTLQQNLKDAQFAPSRNPETGTEETFRWERHVDGVRVQLEFFCPIGTGTPGQLLRNPGKNVGSRISAIRTRAAELAATDYITVTLAGELLDHAGIQDGVPVRVALPSIPRPKGIRR